MYMILRNATYAAALAANFRPSLGYLTLCICMYIHTYTVLHMSLL